MAESKRVQVCDAHLTDIHAVQFYLLLELPEHPSGNARHHLQVEESLHERRFHSFQSPAFI